MSTLNPASPASSSSAYLPAAAVAKILLPIIGAVAALPVLGRLLGMIGLGSRMLSMVFFGLEILLQLGAAVVFLIWTYKIVSAVRQTTGDSVFSPGLAVGCWFIPFANLVMPFLTMRDAWKRAMRDDNRGWIVPLWWFSYLGLVFLRPIVQNIRWTRDTIAIANALGWLVFLLAVGSAAAWFLMVQWVTQKTAPSAS